MNKTRTEINQKFEEFIKTGLLTNELLIGASISRETEKQSILSCWETEKVCSIIDAFNAFVKEFEDKVWYNQKLMDKVKDTSYPLVGKNKYFDVSIFTTGGRVLLTFTDKITKEYITLITADGEERGERLSPYYGPMGIQDVNGTLIVISKMLCKAITNMPKLTKETYVINR